MGITSMSLLRKIYCSCFFLPVKDGKEDFPYTKYSKLFGSVKLSSWIMVGLGGRKWEWLFSMMFTHDYRAINPIY